MTTAGEEVLVFQQISPGANPYPYELMKEMHSLTCVGTIGRTP